MQNKYVVLLLWSLEKSAPQGEEIAMMMEKKREENGGRLSLSLYPSRK